MSAKDREKAVTEALRAHFRPEFLNRVDEVVIYNSLGEAQIHGIVKVQLRDVEKRLKDKKIGISFADDAIDWLAKRGYDPVFGARPLKRVIQTELLNPLSRDLIGGQLKAGDQIQVKVDGQKLGFKKS
jgi:ATP-dependent Clp protease ATP-binding subunit ClpB